MPKAPGSSAALATRRGVVPGRLDPECTQHARRDDRRALAESEDLRRIAWIDLDDSLADPDLDAIARQATQMPGQRRMQWTIPDPADDFTRDHRPAEHGSRAPGARAGRPHEALVAHAGQHSRSTGAIRGLSIAQHFPQRRPPLSLDREVTVLAGKEPGTQADDAIHHPA